MGIQKALDDPKFHCENREPIIIETTIPFKKTGVERMKRMGHTIGSPWPKTYIANPNGIMIDLKTGKLHGRSESPTVWNSNWILASTY
jgi:gamma-glutamyltranspeptidase